MDYDTEDAPKRNELPPKLMPQEPPFNPIRIIRPADPEKLKALHSKRTAIEKQRKAVGLPKTSDRTFNAYK